MGIEPGAMFMASIHDHARSFLEISPIHQRVTDGTSPILERVVERISAVYARRRRLTFEIVALRGGRRTIDKRIESILGCPESKTFRTFLNFEPAHATCGHPTLATRTSQLGQGRLGRLRIEGDTAAETETSIIQISRIALGADQTAAVDNLNDSGPAVVAEFVVVPGDRATATTATNGYLRRRGWRRFERLPAATVEGAVRRHSGHIVLGMAI